jgi:hypothetical protein
VFHGNPGFYDVNVRGKLKGKVVPVLSQENSITKEKYSKYYCYYKLHLNTKWNKHSIRFVILKRIIILRCDNFSVVLA